MIVDLLKEWITILNYYHLVKYLQSCKFVNHFCIKVSIDDISGGSTFANFKAIRSHSCGILLNAFWQFNQGLIFCVLLPPLVIILLIISCSKQSLTSFLPPACSVVTMLLISQWTCKNKLMELVCGFSIIFWYAIGR